MELVERRAQLATLQAALRNASAGHGRVVLVTGESGAGKTALVRSFESRIDGAAEAYWGMCDELITPRPLGPFRDIVVQLGNGAQLEPGDSGVAMLDTIVSELDRRRTPLVVVIEDAHWADEATLDALRFLGRRVARMPLILVITFRDDEIPHDHPLRNAIAAVPPDDVQRVELPPLSMRAVTELAARAGGRDATEIHQLTGGNPFYVAELLAAQGDVGVPSTVQAAVMARVSRLSHGGRACVETAAVMPGRAETSVLEACGVSGRLDEVTRYGLVTVTEGIVTFSHELVRRAVEHALPRARRRALNRQVLTALKAIGADCSRLAHHAVQGGDAEAIVHHAPVAARNAAALDSHREAVAHYDHALVHTGILPDADHAGLLLEYARECVTVQHHAQAVDALSGAADLYRRLPDGQASLGACLAELSEAYWYLGHGQEATNTAQEAIVVLEQHAPGAPLAAAYAQLAKLAMVDFRPHDTIAWGRRALQLAEESGADDVTMHALNTVGCAQWHVPPYDNSPLIESLDRALAADDHRAAARAYNNLADGYVHSLEFRHARHYIEAGMEFTTTYDLPTMYHGLLISRAAWHFEEGRWADALRDADDLIKGSATSEAAAANILAQIAVRTGDGDAEALLEQARRLADGTGDAQDTLPASLTELEHAWLHGAYAHLEPLAEETFQLAIRAGARRWIGAASLWMRRAGRLDDPPPEAHDAYALQIIGSWHDAADTWREIGCPYAEADALAGSTEPEALLDALRILHRLGAQPRADMVRQRLSDLGVPHIPRGPRPAARSNPAGLTPRQVEVLRLLAADLTYQQIAHQLHLSVKTVDHHATAIRTKLGASTRAEAVAASRELGLLQSHESADLSLDSSTPHSVIVRTSSEK